MQMFRILAFTALALIISAVSARGLFAETSTEHTISATVSGQSVSMTVSPTSIDYGTVPFETSRSSLAAPGGAITFTAENTSNVAVDFMVRGTDANGTGTAWALTPDAPGCPTTNPANWNKFRHSVTPTSALAKFLTTAAEPLSENVAADGTTQFTSEIYMPCFGSDGAGEQRSTSIVLTAVAVVAP
jgi:hypothetical protein